MRAPSIILMCVLAFGMSATPAVRAGTEEEERVRETASSWESAWNRHDMKVLASLFTEDADFVNVGARHWKGRMEIERQHAARVAQFSESTWQNKQVAVQFLRPDIALAHVSWALHGDKDPDGTKRPPREGVFTWVLVREGDVWRIRAAQNTNRGNLPSPPGVD